METTPARATAPVTPETPATPEISEPKKPTSGWREVLSTISILVVALLFALFIVTFVFRSYQVEGESMVSTLQNSDKLVIWKVPRSWARVTGHDYIPSRGDIVVFSQGGLDGFSQSQTKQLIKRVIGLPGDRVVLNDDTYTIYNKDHPEGFKPDKTLPYGGKNVAPVTPGQVDVKLGKHQLFVSGDNRPESLDSRAFGPINADQIIGKLVLRVLPVNQAKAF